MADFFPRDGEVSRSAGFRIEHDGLNMIRGFLKTESSRTKRSTFSLWGGAFSYSARKLFQRHMDVFLRG